MIAQVRSGQVPDESIYLHHLAEEVLTEIGAGGEMTWTAENRSGSILREGMIVARHSSGSGVIQAHATALSTQGIGLVTADAEPSVAAIIQSSGIITFADWTPITGSIVLAPLAIYFLSLTSGQLTTAPPTAAGTITQQIGKSVSATQLQVSIEPPILN
jgi:hypothetical protein